eukprot:Gregarina_sp_Poly_1__2591@NODE_1702_length_3512_cov_284_243251_g1115_i0_p5_GENE_NODE_1702_length_3512_cov_284_243251_g1115_i0NODE_1702_length_3512_cov_284_243251_g1115_i0_p5_ORF_typecomplete_len101_score9_96_NODE_1702_length_3512_cov_284_243251_g1115_i07271029
MSSLSCGVLVYVAGECTSDIFHSHTPHDVAKLNPSQTTLSADLEIDGSTVSIASATSAAMPYDIGASYRILVGRLALMICGMTLLAGMMLVELKTNVAIV